MDNTFDRQIATEKLKRLEDAMARLNHYKQAYSRIHENLVTRFTTNTTLWVLRSVFALFTGLSIIVTIAFVFPAWIIDLMNEANGYTMSLELEHLLEDVFQALGVMALIMTLFFIFIGRQVAGNIRKRNTIFKLRQLLSDIIEYMEKSVDEQKMRYEHFHDESARRDKPNS